MTSKKEAIPICIFFKFQAASKQGKIYIGKFKDPTISEEVIREHFTQYGQVVEIQRPVDRSKNSEPKNFCFVTFDKEEPANALLKKVNMIFTNEIFTSAIFTKSILKFIQKGNLMIYDFWPRVNLFAVKLLNSNSLLTAARIANPKTSICIFHAPYVFFEIMTNFYHLVVSQWKFPSKMFTFSMKLQL